MTKPTHTLSVMINSGHRGTAGVFQKLVQFTTPMRPIGFYALQGDGIYMQRIPQGDGACPG